jgi:hypothetical protein
VPTSRSFTRIVALIAIAVLAVLALGASAASAASPWWRTLTLSAPPAPGSEEGEVVFYAGDLGDAPASDEAHPVTIKDVLPAGVRITEVHPEGSGGSRGYNDQSNSAQCSHAGQEVTCKYPLSVLPYEGVVVVVDVKVITPGAGVGVNEATVSGGLLAPVTESKALALEGSPSYGAAHLALTPEEADGSPALDAGSHPFQLTSTFALNTQAVPVENQKVGRVLELQPLALTKDLSFKLPPGLLANATALPKCPDSVFSQEVSSGETVAKCPYDTIVGAEESIIAYSKPVSPWILAWPIYNLEPEYGEPARFGFAAEGIPVILDTAVNATGGDSGATVFLHNIIQEIGVIGAQTTFWGWPADPLHDISRGACLIGGEQGRSCPLLERPPKPFLEMPTSCAGPLATTVEADSWEAPDSLVSFAAEPIPALEACNQVPFSPSMSAAASSDSASSPTGLDVNLNFSDEGLANPGGVAESQIQKTVVTLPEGLTVNPSAGVGLSGCTEADYAAETVGSPQGAGCPNSSKLGTVTIESPLLAAAIHGNVYVAQPFENPSRSLIALYIVAKNPENGILIKLPGVVTPNPVTGQLTTTFEDVPQLPFSHFNFHFREGQQAPLITPALCGSYGVQATLTPWSEPASPLTESSPFQITTGPGGGACPSGGVPPFAPTVIAGTDNNDAGAYSPFYLQIGRQDGEQELTRFSTVMPPGLTGNLSGIPFCPEAAIEHARGATGSQELAEPSCPAASKIGHTFVEAGAGSVLASTPGSLYLAGPYHGAPFSLVSVTSATVGPFDLGTVVIRFALRINPITAQAEVDASGSDPIPHIIDGIVTHVRDIRAYIDRPDFIINPTSCEHMQITSTVTGAGADPSNPADQTPVNVASPFQAADCQNLQFKPSFTAATSGKTSKVDGASLTVKLTYPNAPQGSQANIHSVKVELPEQLPSRLTTLQKACLASVFEANPAACPADSAVGIAKAITPVLPVALTGPAYFVSYGSAKFPELVIVLQGDGVTVQLHGETFISKAGITSSTFKTIPDVPVSSFELTLPQGPFSALAANANLCTLTHTTTTNKKIKIDIKGHHKTITRKIKQKVPASLAMPTTFTAQNGMTLKQTTPITTNGCPKAKTPAKPKKNATNAKHNT